jgi:hypothetical protein
MLHTDVEGHQTHPIPALSINSLKELKEVTDYVGLGHTHMHYEIDNWAFNPGSIEVTNIAEYKEVRGAYVVEVDEDNKVVATHVTDYRQRPFQRLAYNVTGRPDAATITAEVLDIVRENADPAAEGEPEPIVEITLRGQLGFPNSLLELQKIRDEAQKITGALVVRVKNHSAPVEYAVAADLEEDASREKLEQRVIEDLVSRDNRYKNRAADISEAVIGAKRLALSDEPAEKIADFIALKIAADTEQMAKN